MPGVTLPAMFGGTMHGGDHQHAFVRIQSKMLMSLIFDTSEYGRSYPPAKQLLVPRLMSRD